VDFKLQTPVTVNSQPIRTQTLGTGGARYEHSVIAADGYFVMVYGRFSGNGRPVAWIAVDIVRIEDGFLSEDWDVTQDVTTKEASLRKHR
jgi:predicted SnoaL-like aldol condensation-catalyzing enzyme